MKITPTHMKVDYSPDDEDKVRMTFFADSEEWSVDLERNDATMRLSISLIAHLISRQPSELQGIYSTVRFQLGLDI